MEELKIHVFNIDALNYCSNHNLADRNGVLSASYLAQLILMSQRLSHYRKFELQELVTHFRDIYSICYREILLSSKIDLVVFGGLPHSVADYLLYLAAKALNIECIISQDFPIFPGGSIFTTQI